MVTYNRLDQGSVSNIDYFYNRIKENPIDYSYLGKSGRDYENKPTTELEDKYLALDDYAVSLNVPNKKFIYPENIVTRYLNGIEVIKEDLGMVNTLNEEGIKALVQEIVDNKYLIGSKVFMEIFHDMGLDNLITDKISEEVLPILDLYKHFALAKYFNYEHISFGYSKIHRDGIDELINKYPYLKEYLDKEINNTKEIYRELFLRMCFYIYMIKICRIPRDEKLRDEALFNDVNRIRNRIRLECVFSETEAIAIEEEVIEEFFRAIYIRKREIKKFSKTMRPYRDR